MGLNSRFLRLMLELKRRGSLSGTRVIEIGAQQLGDSFLADREGIAALCTLFGARAPEFPIPQAINERLGQSAPRARSFYEALGFHYACVDIDGSPCSIPLDLNFDSVPPKDIGRYDLVTNFGTTEHVANQLNAFRAIHDLAKVGAVMIHELPAQGHINHGLVNYQPKFFKMLARSNEYEILHFDYLWDQPKAGLPDSVKFDLVNFVDFSERPAHGVSEAAMLVAFKKIEDAPFIPPIDVPTGSRAPNESVAASYPTVFKKRVPPWHPAKMARTLQKIRFALSG